MLGDRLAQIGRHSQNLNRPRKISSRKSNKRSRQRNMRPRKNTKRARQGIMSNKRHEKGVTISFTLLLSTVLSPTKKLTFNYPTNS